MGVQVIVSWLKYLAEETNATMTCYIDIGLTCQRAIFQDEV